MAASTFAKRTILLTRPLGQSEKLKEQINAAGGRVLQLPSLEIKAIADSAAARQLLTNLTGFDIIVFVSRNAVKYACELMPDIVGRAHGKTLLAVGSGTNEELLNAGFAEAIFTSCNSGSEALLEMTELQQANVLNRKILIVRGQGGRELLGDNLLERGAKVQYAELYRRTKPQIDADIVSKIWQQEKPDAVVITSAEGLNNLLALTATKERPIFLNTNLVVISQRLRSIADSLGFVAAIKVAMGYSDDDFMLALQELFGANEHER